MYVTLLRVVNKTAWMSDFSKLKLIINMLRETSLGNLYHKVSSTDEYFYSSRATILMSVSRKFIVIYASTQNWSSDLNESKVGIWTCKKRGLEKFCTQLCQSCAIRLFFFPMLGCFLFKI